VNAQARYRAAALALALTVATAGCGSATGQAQGGPAPQATAAGAPLLATSLVTAAGTWAVVVMGGSAATHNNFWQLFVRPAGSTGWKLVTPPGAADNGGLVVAGADGGQSLITGIRPSQYLTYTPLILTRDGGQAWSPAGPLAGPLANVPDALAPAPRTGNLLALLATGTAESAAPGYTSWHTLASLRTLRAAPAGRRCGLRALTAAGYTQAGLPLLAGTCSRPGTAGIFTARDGTWQASGPRLPTAQAHQPVTVLRLAQAANRTVALLEAGTGPAAALLTAWSTDGGSHWALSPPLKLAGAKPDSASFGPSGAATVVLSGNRAQAIAGAGDQWQSLPALPAGTATLAPGPAGGFDALAVHRTRLTVWQLDPGSATWRTTQTLNVPIQFGSSG
jgi:hypothetical protein